MLISFFERILAQTPLNSHFFLNQINENPANTALYEDRLLSLNYRNQLPGLGANYVNYGIFYSQPVGIKNSSLGLSMINDVQGKGIINNFSASGIYGYKVKLANRSYLHFGLKSSLVQKSYNLNNLVFEDNNELLAGENVLYLDFGSGLKATFNNFYFGGAVFNATPPLFLINSNANITNNRTYLFETGLNVPLKLNPVYQPELFISPSLMIKFEGGHQLVQFGTSITKNHLQLGFWLRQDYIFNYDAIVFSFAFLQPKFNFVYSYDVKPPWLMHFFQYSGAHEVTFLIKFMYNEKRKFRAIKCPKI